MRFSQIRNKILIFAIIVIVILLFNFFQQEVKSFFYFISSPIQRTLWVAGDNISEFFGGIIKSKKIKEENENLKSHNQELLAEIAALTEFKKENEDLRNALGISLNKDFKLVFTQITSKDISQDYILINKGSEDGLSKDLPVVTSQKVLVGRINEVYNHFSKVMLISDKKSSFDAEILGRSVYGVVKGKGNFKIGLELVPRESEIKEGDLIVTIYLGGIFPKGILVGQINEIHKSDVEPFQIIDISPSFDIRNSENLFIILNPNG